MSKPSLVLVLVIGGEPRRVEPPVVDSTGESREIVRHIPVRKVPVARGYRFAGVVNRLGDWLRRAG